MPYHSIVEGDWGNGKYKFRKILKDDWEAVVKHVQMYFLRDEPMAKLLGYCDKFGEEYGEIIKAILVDDLSFLVETTDSKELVAVRLTYRHNRSNNFNDLPMTTRQGKILMKNEEIMENMADLFKRYEVEQYAEFFLVSCAPEHRRQGIATELYSRCVKFLQAEGFKLVKVLATSPYTIKAAKKLGFVEICKYNYGELCDETGVLAYDPKHLTSFHFEVVLTKEL